MKVSGLLDHQQTHYNNILTSIQKHSRSLDASDTGTGKTYTSVRICKDLKLIPFIICPKSVVTSWNKVLKIFGFNLKEYFIITYDQLALSNLVTNTLGEYTWNFETDAKFKGDNKKKYLFVYDEAHKCKNKNTINSKIMLNLSTCPVKILLLSATIIDKPLYFIPFGIVLGLYKTIQEGIDWMSQKISNKASNPLLPIHKILFNEYASRMRIDDTVGVFKNNKILFEGIQMKNYYQIEEKYDKLTMLLEQSKKNKKRQDKKDILDKELKDKQNKEKKIREENKYKNDLDSDDDFIDINKKVNNEEVDCEDNVDCEDLYDPGDVSSDTDSKKKDVGIGKIQRIRQEIELLRVDTIYELTLKYLLDGKSIAIFVNFTKTIEELSSRLKTKCIIWGSQSIKERSKSIDDFCSDKSRVIICNIMSGGCGINLHDINGTYPRVSIISPTWSAQDLIQVLGRIHRAMGKTDCVQQIIFCKGTIEESVGNVIKSKISNIRVFNDGDKQLKKDNMEVILNQEMNKKQKKEEIDNFIYKVNDFDAIQNRIDYFERQVKRTEKELSEYTKHSDKHKECDYRLSKIKKEHDFNINMLNKTIENMIN
jgi:superfamily II DNA or RNA helicase